MAKTLSASTHPTTDDTNQPGVYQYRAGLDIGNGYVKGLIEHIGDRSNTTTDLIDMPSSAARLIRPNQLPEKDSVAGSVVADDFYNQIDVSFHSPMVGDSNRRLCGVRSLSARGALDEFDLVGHRSKSEQELSKVLVMSIVAAKAVRDYVSEHGRLPVDNAAGDPAALVAHVTAALALPINEYTVHRHSYAAQFTGAGTSDADGHSTVHTAVVNNFETPITVKIIFDAVTVIAEGASAQYAITQGGTALMNGMLADVRRRGMALEGITAEDVLSATNTIGIDIGEGTVNFPVFTNGKFNVDASRTFAKGYGTVLESTLVAMTDAGMQHSFTSRKQLGEYLRKEPNALKRTFHERVSQYAEQQAEYFVEDVTTEFSRVLADVGALTEVAYVYGGGSGPLRGMLHDALIKKVEDMNSESGVFPVMYLDSSYSRKLNREGLMIAARTITNPR